MKAFKSTKHLVGFLLIAFHCILNIASTIIAFSKLSDIINTFISLLPAVMILCYLFLGDETFNFRKHIFPLAFGMISSKNLYVVVVSIVSTPKYLLFENGTIILFAFSLILLLFNILCFIGTLFDFRFLILLKIGCIGYISTIFIMEVYEFFLLGGMDYINSIPKVMLPINIISLVKYLSIILFYAGISISTTNKKNTNLV